MTSGLRWSALAIAVLVALSGCSTDTRAPASSDRGLPPDALDAGLRVTLNVKQATAGSAQVTFTAVVADDDGSGPGYTVNYGDGKTSTVPAPTVACVSNRSAPTPIARTITLRHRYAKAGTYAVSLAVTSGSPTCPLPARETQTALTLVNVAGG